MKGVQRANVGARIREIRESRNLSQQGVARQLGITQESLSLYERGLRQIKANDLPRFAAALGVRPADLYEEQDTEQFLESIDPDVLWGILRGRFKDGNLQFPPCWSDITVDPRHNPTFLAA